MPYIRDHARFTILDDMPADVWQEPEPEPMSEYQRAHGPYCSDPEQYLCIVSEEPADYHGSFEACVYTAALYQCDHVPVGAGYLRDSCTLAPEDTARTILAHYIRSWALLEDEDTADLLRDEADRIATASA